MKEQFSETAIVNAVARTAMDRILRRTVAILQKMSITLSGDDSGLATTWDEICVQIQFENSHAWELYDETVREVVAVHVHALAQHEKGAVWLQTEEAAEWLSDDPGDRNPDPVCDHDIINHITSEVVYEAAGR